MNRTNALLIVLLVAMGLGLAVSNGLLSTSLILWVVIALAAMACLLTAWFYFRIHRPNKRLNELMQIQDPEERLRQIEAMRSQSGWLSDVQYYNLLSVVYLDLDEIDEASKSNLLYKEAAERESQGKQELVDEIHLLYLHNECYNLIFSGEVDKLGDIVATMDAILERQQEGSFGYVYNALALAKAKLAMQRGELSEARMILNRIEAETLATGAAHVANLLTAEYDLRFGLEEQAVHILEEIRTDCTWKPAKQAAARMLASIQKPVVDVGGADNVIPLFGRKEREHETE